MPNEIQRIPTLSPQQEQALRLLLAGRTVTDTAREVGVGRDTVSRWRNSDPRFVAAYRTRQHELWEATRVELTAASAEFLRAKLRGVRALAAVLDDPGAEPSDVVRAGSVLARLPIPKIPEKPPARPATTAEVVQGWVEGRAHALMIEAQLGSLGPSPAMLQQAARELRLPLRGD